MKQAFNEKKFEAEKSKVFSTSAPKKKVNKVKKAQSRYPNTGAEMKNNRTFGIGVGP